MLTISVKNFGPIAEGSVDLKPLTIFVGPGNTGKSYMATAVYAVATVAQGGDPVWGFAQNRVAYPRRFRGFSRFRKGEETDEIAQSLFDWASRQTREGRELPEITVSDYPGNVRAWLEATTHRRLNLFRHDVVDQLRQIHGEEPGFVSHGQQPGDFRLTVRRNDPVLSLEMRLNEALETAPELDISRFVAPSEASLIQSRLFEFEDERVGFEIARILADTAYEHALTGWPDQSYYLPAARSGIVQGHKVLSAALVRQSSFVGLHEMRIPTLPGITTEFLGHLISLDRRVGRHEGISSLEKAIAFIEANVLHGDIYLDESTGLPYPEIAYETTAGKFTLEHTSSMVSELAPLILFLKYLVRPGDLLILEEPESHLHPAAQRQLARGLVRLVNAGAQVLITTHSDTIISQINNLLALNQASPELIAEGGFEAEDFLRQDQVGAYLFCYDQELHGSKIAHLEIDPDTGIDENEFAAVFEAIYDESIALQRDRS